MTEPSYDEQLAVQRAAYAAQFGTDAVWTTEELQRDFEVLSFCYGVTTVVRRADGVKGTLTYGLSPRIYYGFVPVSRL